MIHLDKPISSNGYGIAVVSAETFQELCKEHRIRSKKMLTYFDKNHNVFYDFIKKGAFVPIPRIRAYYYQIFITINNNRTTNYNPQNEMYQKLKQNVLFLSGG